MSNYSDSSFNEESANTSWYKVFSMVPDGAKVLDVGCSSGNFGVELIKRKNCTVDGLELDADDSKEAAKKLRNVFEKNVETDELSQLDRNYDVIYFGDVIEHLVNPSYALKKISNHLAKDGKIVFSIPNMAHISIRLALLGGEFEYTETGLLDKTHLHFYTLAEVKRVFNDAGLIIDHLDFVEKDYPKVLIEKELNKWGLKADKSFYKRMQSPEISAFQFVGSASASAKAKRTKLKQFGPVDLFDGFHNDIVTGYQTEISRLKKIEVESKRQKQLLEDLKKRPHKVILRKLKQKVKS